MGPIGTFVTFGGAWSRARSTTGSTGAATTASSPRSPPPAGRHPDPLVPPVRRQRRRRLLVPAPAVALDEVRRPHRRRYHAGPRRPRAPQRAGQRLPGDRAGVGRPGRPQRVPGPHASVRPPLRQALRRPRREDQRVARPVGRAALPVLQRPRHRHRLPDPRRAAVLLGPGGAGSPARDVAQVRHPRRGQPGLGHGADRPGPDPATRRRRDVLHHRRLPQQPVRPRLRRPVQRLARRPRRADAHHRRPGAGPVVPPQPTSATSASSIWPRRSTAPGARSCCTSPRWR